MEDGRDTRALTDWLTAEGLVAERIDELFDGFCRRLVAAGVALCRAHVSMPARAPDFESIACTWRRDGTVDYRQFPHGGYDREPFRSSPLRHMIEQRCPVLRRRLDGNDPQLDFPVLRELRDEGMTDYLAQLRSFQRQFHGLGRSAGLEGVVSSFTTDRPGGFSDADLAAIDRTLPLLFLALYRVALSRLLDGLLGAYVGAEAGRRVLMGQTKRGTVERRSAIILLSDLRGFSALMDRSEGEAVVRLLDDSFEATVEPIEEAGGEILKFLGDGLLAMFPLEGADPARTCATALDAASAIHGRMNSLNAARSDVGEAPLVLDIVLHLGTVMYGNVGSERRVDFTVIGAAVNEASRIEKLCEPLDRHLLVSASFAAACERPLVSLGSHSLRGIQQPQEIFGLA